MHRHLLLTVVLGCGIMAGLARADETAQPMQSAAPPPGLLDTSLRNEVNAAIDRGLDWLAQQQKPDGSWSNSDFPGLSGLCLWPFARVDHPQREAVVSAATAYLLSCVQTNGAIYREIPGRKGGGLSNYNTAIAMTALHALGQPEYNRIVQRARSYLAGAQYTGADEYDGGFGYDATTDRAYTDLLNTFYAAQAMRLTADVEETRPAGEPRADIDWAATVRYVGRMQNPETAGAAHAGGFFYNPTDPKAGTDTNAAGEVVFRSFGSMTYAGLLALVFADVSREDVRVRSALRWAERHWTLDENPGMGQEGRYFFYHVLARALHATGHDLIRREDQPPIAWREQTARMLLGLQRIDPATGNGYWINENGRYWENDPALVTAYCLLALQTL